MQVPCWLFMGVVFAIAAADDDVFNTETCGSNGYEKSIERPSISRLREFPWLARMGYRRNNATEFHFHGTLIHPYYVVTTTVVAGYYSNSMYMVRLGDYHTATDRDCQEINDVEQCAPQPQDIPIEYTIKHPDYNKPKEANDLVLVKLQQPAAIDTEFVRPICVPTEAFGFPESASLFLSAWCGSVKTGISVVPFQFRMQKIGPAVCTEKLSKHIRIELHESQFCATLDLGGKKSQPKGELSLRGSVGSPLQMQDKSGRFFLMGFTSLGVKKAARDTPYVFTNVVHHADWLRRTVTREEQLRKQSYRHQTR